MMMIDEKFQLGQVVYVKTDIEQSPGMVTAINIRPGHVTYLVTTGDSSVCFYDFELSAEKSNALHL